MLLSIQVCRGLAALSVLLFHLGGALAAPKYFDEPIFLEICRAGGALGVDFFFVLSGFIIATVHWTDIGDSSRLPTSTSPFGAYLGTAIFGLPNM